MNVEQLMTTKVHACTERDSLQDVATTMAEQDIGVVPVCEARRVIGIITDRDICLAAQRERKPLHELPVRAAMSESVMACQPNETILDVEERMRRGQIRRMPVVDEERRLLGILSLNDLALASRTHDSGGVAPQEIARTLAEISRHTHPPHEEAAFGGS